MQPITGPRPCVLLKRRPLSLTILCRWQAGVPAGQEEDHAPHLPHLGPEAERGELPGCIAKQGNEGAPVRPGGSSALLKRGGGGGGEERRRRGERGFTVAAGEQALQQCSAMRRRSRGQRCDGLG